MFFGHSSRLIYRWLLLFAAPAACCLCARDACAQPKAHVGVSAAGGGTYLPERWGTVQLTFANLEDKPVELFAATYFDRDRSQQFCRKTWVPAQSRVILSHPIHLPTLEEGGIKGFDYHTLLVDTSQGSEVLVRDNQRDLEQKGRLRLGEEPATALMNMPDEFGLDAAARELPYELIVACKSSQLLGRAMAQLNDSIFPAAPEAYACIDQIIVADNRLTHDGPAIAAIRRWLFSGGHLWIMLDRVEPQLVELLLGDEFHCQVVDRVELTTVKIVPVVRAVGEEISMREYDQGVGMVRTLISDVEVSHTVDGWPAAFWKHCGEGRLLVTTLSPEGWMRQGITEEEAGPISRANPRAPRALDGPAAFVPQGPPPADPQEAALVNRAKGRTYFVVPPMKDIAMEFFSPRNPQIVDAKVFEPQVTEYVGSSVPSRWFITSLLGGFGAALAGLGVVLWRNGRLEWLGAAGPALAVGVSATLMVAGLTQRRSIPATVASVQFVEPLSGTDDMLISGQTDVFAPDAAITVMASQSGGWITPDRKGQEGQTARMVWTDLETWEWQHLPPKYGHQVGEFSTASAAVNRMEAKATFGKNGLTGRLSTAALSHPSDAVLATRDGRIGVDLKEDGSFQALASHVFSGEQFIAADLLTDEQNRRTRTLAAIFTTVDRPKFPSEPKLLVWADPLDLGFQFDKGHRQLGAALIAVPLLLERPPAGTEVAIPSPFLPYRQVDGPDGSVAAGLYEHRKREWQQRSRPSSAWLRFQVPSVVLPLEPLRAKITVQVTGPVGKLEIAGLRGKQAVPVKTWMDPVGTLSYEIDDPALLHVVDGGLLVRVSGGDPARPGLTQSVGKANYWQIESLHVDLQGKTASPPANQP